MTKHCIQCNYELISYVLPAHTKYRCNVCRYIVPKTTKACKFHPNDGSYGTKYADTLIVKKCKNCNFSSKSKINKSNLDIEP